MKVIAIFVIGLASLAAELANAATYSGTCVGNFYRQHGTWKTQVLASVYGTQRKVDVTDTVWVNGSVADCAYIKGTPVIDAQASGRNVLVTFELECNGDSSNRQIPRQRFVNCSLTRLFKD